jgi:fibronectin-binding autotransporter adhesin
MSSNAAARSLIAALILAAGFAVAPAATLTWDANGTTATVTDGAGAWVTGTNWWNGTSNTTWTSGDDAVFGVGGTGGAVTLSATTSVASLTFNTFAGTYTLGTAGTTLTIGAGGLTMNSGSGIVSIISPMVLGAAQSWTNNKAGTLTVSGNVGNGGNTLTVSGSGASTLSGTISGAGGLTKSGTGTLTLSGSNAYTGSTQINAGILSANNASALGSGTIGFGGGTLRYNAASAGQDWSGRFKDSTSSIALDTNAQNVTLAGGIDSTNVGGLTKLGSGTLTLSVSNSYTGSTQINGGTLLAGHASALSSGTISFGGGTLQYTAASAAQDWSGRIKGSTSSISLNTNAQNVTLAGGIDSTNVGGLTKLGSGTLTLSGSNGYSGATTVSAGELHLLNGSFNRVSSITSGTGGTLRLTSAIVTNTTTSQFFISGTFIQESGTYTVASSAGDMRLGGQDNASGLYRMEGGYLSVASGPYIGNNSSSAFIQTGGTVDLTRAGAILQLGGATNRSSTGEYTISGGTLNATTVGGSLMIGNAGVGSTGRMTIQSAAVVNALTITLGFGASAGVGILNLEGGVLRVNTVTNSGTGAVHQFNFSGGTLSPYNANSTIGSLTANNNTTVTLSGTTATMSSNDKDGIGRTVTVHSKLTGAGDITFIGSGTHNVNSALNDYTGTTRISAGTLALGVNGGFSSSPTIIVGGSGSSGAVLDLTAKTSAFSFGSGQIVGGIGRINIGAGKTVSSAGIWAPGNSIGSNTVTGNLTLTGTSQFELGTPGTSTASPGTSDFTAVSGTLTLGGDLTLSDNAGAGGNGFAAGGAYRLFTYGNAVSGSYASVTTNPTPTTRTSLSNISLGGSGTGVGQGVFLSVYNLAAGSVASGTTVNFGTVLKNTPLSQALSITNTAPGNAYSEKLGTSFGASTGLASGSGSWSLLSAGGTSTALTVFLASGSAGAASGLQTVNFTSDGAGSSGLAAVGAGSQTVNLVATVLDPAVASFASGPAASTSLLLDFGSVNQDASVAPLGFSLYNLMQTAGYTADLALYEIDQSFALDTEISTTLSEFYNLASGSSNSYTASFSTATAGSFTNVYTLRFKSANNGAQFASDTPQSLTLTVQGVIIVPEPGTLALAGVGVAVAGALFVRRRRG